MTTSRKCITEGCTVQTTRADGLCSPCRMGSVASEHVPRTSEATRNEAIDDLLSTSCAAKDLPEGWSMVRTEHLDRLRSSEAISSGDTVQVNCPESPEHKEERQGWMGTVVRRNVNACTVEFFADHEERIYEAHRLVKVGSRNRATETATDPMHGQPRVRGQGPCVDESCRLDEHPGWVEDAMGVVVCESCGAIANFHLEDRRPTATVIDRPWEVADMLDYLVRVIDHELPPMPDHADEGEQQGRSYLAKNIREARNMAIILRGLRRERATDRPKVISTPNADAGDSTNACEVCGQEIDEPHTWEECARLSRSFADQATSYTCDLSEEVKRLEAALDTIANDPHCSYVTDVPMTEAEGQYRIGVADGHRCAAEKARKALAGHSSSDPKEGG
jgi:hypothetical protein